MPIKKLLLSLALAGLILVLGQYPVLAADDPMDLDNITEEQLKKEPPLTQKDIDLFLEFINVSSQLSTEGTEEQLLERGKNAAIKFIQDNKITPVRLRYIGAKIPAVMVFAQNPASQPPADSDQAYLIPSAAEKKLVQDNQPKIMTVLQGLAPPAN
ncbi:MAG: hypothetical protein LBK52_07125 [Deltaproteobacteria bacterium]|jgi:hypothetical protein|nr:hypothetical protein [Deltaproteobacteria bacterium]